MPYKWKGREERKGTHGDKIVQSSLLGREATIDEHVSAIMQGGMCCHMNDFKMHSDKYLMPDSEWSQADKDKLIAHRKFATDCCRQRMNMNRDELENLNEYFIELMRRFNGDLLEGFPEDMENTELYEYVKNYIEE